MIARYRAELLTLAVIVVGVAIVGTAMYRLSYDIWVAFVIGPVLLVVTFPMLRHVLGDELRDLFPILALGFFVKLVGCCLRYFVVFDAYGKNGDAETYFDTGNALAAQVRNGKASFFELIPLARDTRFVEKLTGLIFYFMGPTRLGGFFIFATFAYWGTVSLVRAAHMAVPGLAVRRYAWFCALAPSLVFWPSSLGKEAWILGCLGFFSLGVAKVLTWNGRSGGAVLALLSALGMGTVRPHIAAVFLAATTFAVVQSVILPPQPSSMRRRSASAMLALASLGTVVFAATVTVKFLGAGRQDSGSTGSTTGIAAILRRTTGQTLQGGSSFTPIDTSSPRSWPYAIFRTLTRPLLNEATSISTLIPAIETTALVVIAILGWRRLAGLLQTMRRSPFFTYAFISTMMFGLAFTAVANLGILVRQRSLVTAFVALMLCGPPRRLTTEAPPPPSSYSDALPSSVMRR